MKRAPGALARSVTLHLEDWLMIEQYAQANDFNTSLAVRQIICEWAEMKKEKEEKETA